MAKRKRKSSVTDSAEVSTLRRREPGEHKRVDPAPVSYNRIWREMHMGLYAAIPAVLAVLTSLNSLWNQFAFDDKQQVLGNEFIKRLSNLPLLFTSSVWAFSDSLQSASRDPYYRPMFMGLFTVNYSIFGTAAWGWHLVNVLVHVGVTLLVWLVVKEMTDRKGVATIAAALFAVHPAHSESVAWISGVTDPLMALFVLTSFYFYLRFKKTGRKSLMALGLVLFLPAALTKETAFALPLVIACCEIFYFRGAQGLWKRTASAATIALLFCVPAVVYFVMRYIALGRLLAPPGSRFESITAVLTGPLVILKYLGLLLVPIGYNLHHYTAPVGSFLKFSFIGPLILVGAMAAALVLSKSRDLWFAGSWFLIWLLPPLAGLSLFEPEYFVQERYLYLPSVGVCLALAMGIERLATLRMFKLSKEMTATAVTAAVLILFSFVYIKQNSVWMNTLSLFQHCADSNPGLTEPLILLSTEYYVEGNRQKAEEETRRALEMRPDCLDALIYLSQFAYNDGKLDSAIEYLENARSALTDGPQHRGYLARICGDLGTLYAERKDFELAESFLRRAVEVMPYPLNWFALGNYYFDRGRYAEALEMYELTEAATSKKYAPLRLKLARTYDRLGQTQRARDEYNKYLDLAPNAKDRSEIFRRLSQL